MIEAAQGTVVLYTDIGCPWATLAVHRLHTTRSRLGMEGAVVIDHRAFPLELFNERPTPKRTLDAEIPVVGALSPDFGWRVWQDQPHHWPVTTLPALEAVQAAKEQGLAASEALDLALRRAFFADSRCISLRHVIVDVAESCAPVDAEALTAALDDGRARATVMEQQRTAAGDDDVKGSPHVFLPDGTDLHNPGIEQHWEGEQGQGFPVVDADDPSVYERILKAAAG